jgi:hypothetical protein
MKVGRTDKATVAPPASDPLQLFPSTVMFRGHTSDGQILNGIPSSGIRRS